MKQFVQINIYLSLMPKVQTGVSLLISLTVFFNSFSIPLSFAEDGHNKEVLLESSSRSDQEAIKEAATDKTENQKTSPDNPSKSVVSEEKILSDTKASPNAQEFKKDTGEASLVAYSSSTQGNPGKQFNVDNYYAKVGKNVLERNGELNVSDQNGALSYAYPIRLPEALGNFQPILNLEYLSQSGEIENLAGYKWELTANKIYRAGRGTDRQYQKREFYLNLNGGGGKLVQTEETNGEYGVYRFEHGGQPEKAIFQSDNTWEVYDGDGTKYAFTETLATYEWHLTKVTDTDENVTEYGYEKRGGPHWVAENISQASNLEQIYPERIRYNGGNTEIKFQYEPRPDVILDGKRGFLIQTADRLKQIEIIVLGKTRRKYELTYGLNETGSRSLLKKIKETGVSEAGESLSFPETEFGYSSNGGKGWRKQENGYVFPPEIATGYSTYQKGIIDLGIRFLDVNGDGVDDLIQGCQKGLNVCANGQSIYLHNRVNGYVKSETFFPEPLVTVEPVAYGEPTWSRTDGGKRILDVNGDGLEDYIVAASYQESETVFRSRQEVWINKGNYVWEKSTISFPEIFEHGNAQGTYDKGVQLADINGDGLTDIVRGYRGCAGLDQWDPCPRAEPWIKRVYINTGTGWTRDPVWEAHMPEVYFTNANSIEKTSQDSGSRFVDVNGDSLLDIVMSGNNSLWINKVYLNTGHGWADVWDYNFGFPGTTGIAMTTTEYNNFYGKSLEMDQGYRFLDVNGDGLTDLVRGCGLLQNKSGGQCRYGQAYGVYINKGNKWELDPGWGQTWDTVPEMSSSILSSSATAYNEFYTEFSGVQIADLNNDGLPDYFQRIQPCLTCQRAATWQTELSPWIYFNQSSTPDLLVKVKNNLGGETEVRYQLSSKYPKAYNQATGARVNANLMTVSEIIYKDHPNNDQSWQKVTYTYEDGYYYYNTPDEKEFAGFGIVMKTDSGGNQTKYYYHQGNGDNTGKGEMSDDIEKQGHAYRIERLDQTGKLLTAVLKKWEKTPLPSIEAGKRNFIKLTRETGITYDLSGNFKGKLKTYLYDDETGDLLEERDYGEVTVNEITGDLISNLNSDDLLTLKTYAKNEARNLYNYPVEEIVKDESGKIWAKTETYWDNQSLGVVTIGHLTKQSQYFSDENRYLNEEFTYNEFGKVIKKKDAKGNEIKVEYDQSLHLYPLKLINAKNQTLEFQYDYATGKILKIKDLNGVETSYTYDPLGRIKEMIVPKLEGAGTEILKKYVYNDQVFPTYTESYVQNKDDAGDGYHKNAAYYDGMGRMTLQITESGDNQICSGMIYGKTGLKIKDVQSYACTGYAYTALNVNQLGINYEYDGLNRIIKSTSPIGTVITNYNLRVTETIDPLGRKKQSEEDAFGRVVKTREYLSGRTLETKYFYDALGRLLKILDPVNDGREFLYDSLGRMKKSSEWYLRGGTVTKWWEYKYDDLGNRIYQKNPKGEVITNVYDELNRLLKRAYAGFIETYTYDTAVNGIGKLAEVVYKTGKTKYAYDLLGRINKETKEIGGNIYVTETKTDEARKIKEITYPDLSKVTYRYDQGGNLKSVNSETGGIETPIITAISYTARGQMQGINYGNGVKTLNTYDANQLYRLVEKKTTKNSNLLQSFGYSYDKVGNILTIADAVKGETSQYEYDELNRLKKSTVASSSSLPPYTETYTYSDIGNITAKSGVGTYEYKAQNPQQVTKAGGILHTYDSYGNRRTDGQFTYDWNALGELIRTTSSGGEIVSYEYDQTGKRIKKTNQKTNTSQIYLGSLCEETKTGSWTAFRKYIFAGNQRIATIEDTGEIYYHHPDHLGSASIITTPAGDIVSDVRYYAYGKTRYENSSFTTPYKYNDKELDAESTLYYYGARYYDARIGRWVSNDPWQRVDITQNNGYAYVEGNPIIYIDPEGLKLAIKKDNDDKEFANKSLDALKSLSPYVKSYDQDGKYVIGIDMKALVHDRKNGGIKNKNGTILILKIIIDDNMVTIWNSSKNYHSPNPPQNAYNGKGSNSDVYFNPDKKGNVSTYHPETEIAKNEQRPSYISLGHELIHSSHAIKGTSLTTKPGTQVYCLGLDGSRDKAYPEEFRTVGLGYNEFGDITENDLRAENGLNLRNRYTTPPSP